MYLQQDLNQWINQMCQLSPEFAQCPLRNIVLPGSHDAASYTLTTFTDFSVTQQKSLVEQFELGVRYFDIRIKKSGSGYAFYHGMVSSEAGICESELGPLCSAAVKFQEPIILKLDFDAPSTFASLRSGFLEPEFGDHFITPNLFRGLPISTLISLRSYIAILTKNGGQPSEISCDYKSEAFGQWSKTRARGKLLVEMQMTWADMTASRQNMLKVIHSNQPALVGSGGHRTRSVLKQDTSEKSRDVLKLFLLKISESLLDEQARRKGSTFSRPAYLRGVINLDNIGADNEKDDLVCQIIALNDPSAYILVSD